MGCLTRWPETELHETAEYIARYKAVRSTIQTGHQFWLGSPADSAAHAVQYVARDGGESVVFQWRVGPAEHAAVPRLRLRGLDSETVYRVDDDSGVLPTNTLRSGAALTAYGLPVGGFASRADVAASGVTVSDPVVDPPRVTERKETREPAKALWSAVV